MSLQDDEQNECTRGALTVLLFELVKLETTYEDSHLKHSEQEQPSPYHGAYNTSTKPMYLTSVHSRWSVVSHMSTRGV